MKRADYLALLEAALAAREAGFAGEAARAWLADWPGDLAVQFVLARAHQAAGRRDEATGVLWAVLQHDPEWRQAWELLMGLLPPGDQRSAVARACLAILDPSSDLPSPLPPWAVAGLSGRLSLLQGDLKAAGEALGRAVAAAPPVALPYLLHFRTARSTTHAEALPAAIALGEAYLAQWPLCVALQLGLAHCLMNAGADQLLAGGSAGRAAALLHAAAAADPAGQVARRVWPPTPLRFGDSPTPLRFGDYGGAHARTNPYRDLWPLELAGHLPGPVPAAVSALLGKNRLAGNVERSNVERSPLRGLRNVERSNVERAGKDALHEVQSELNWVRARLYRAGAFKNKRAQPKQAETEPAGGEEDARTPAYIILASQDRLRQKYGAEAAEGIIALIRSQAVAVARRPGWRSYPVLLDSAESLAPFAAAAPLEPADPANAWSIKLLLHDLDVALARRGEMIGALLLVGGHDLLPFHLLPNPTDDSDDEVPSDNPYATRDENYFVPEWPVGRLPAGKGNDPLLLLKQLRGVIAGQRVPGQVGKGARWLGGFPVWAKWLRALIQLFTRRRPPTGSGQRPPATGPAAPGESFGYAASVWKSASMAVFNTIGEPRALLTSPPVEASRLPGSGPGPGKLSYFNLHGIEDGPNWYGQREPGGPLSSQPEYPVALRPADVVNSGRAPQIVFSEACYGAHIAGKAVDEALSLKFLDAGARAVIGSTCVAYGSVATPLIGADLLGQAFWEYLARGLPAGEALRRARISLARIMDRRQGYLDGEDQKTLISFVYFGDPLFRPGGLQPGPSKNPKTGVYRTRSLPAQTCLACDRRSAGRDNAPPDAQTLAQVKSIVARYLPGMQGATYAVTQPHTDCNGGDHLCPTAHLGAGSRGAKSAPAAHHRVITLSKVVQSSQHAHPRFARLTINAEGKVLKLAVSR